MNASPGPSWNGSPSYREVMARLNLLVDKVDWIAARVSTIEQTSSSLMGRLPGSEETADRPSRASHSQQTPPTARPTPSAAGSRACASPPAAGRTPTGEKDAAGAGCSAGRASAGGPVTDEEGRRERAEVEGLAIAEDVAEAVFEEAPARVADSPPSAAPPASGGARPPQAGAGDRGEPRAGGHAAAPARTPQATDRTPPTADATAGGASEPAVPATAPTPEDDAPLTEQSAQVSSTGRAGSPPQTEQGSAQPPRAGGQRTGGPSSFWRRISTEGQAGRYLLSLAAALLILMAGASLIALLWNSIPDYVKVLVVALTGMALTGTGAWTARRPRSNRVAAATVMGTGGGLVYVAIIGSVLLGEIDADIAFFLLTAWSLLLVILAVRTRILFTMLIVGAGGAVTVVLAGTYAGDHPDQALAAIWAICLHSICLGAVCAIVARASAPAKLRAAYAGPSFVVTVVAGAVAPLDAASRISFASAASALALTLLLSFLQYGLLAHWEAERAPENAHFIGGGWFAVDLAAMFVLLRLYTAPEGTWDPMWKFALIAAVMTGTALLAAATPMEWHVAVYAGISSSVATTLFAMACRSEWSDRPEMLVVVIAAVGLSAAPSIRHRDGTPTLTVPCALIAMGARSHSDADRAVLALSGVVVAAAVMAAASLRARDRRVPVASTWLLAAILVVFVPLNAADLLDASGVRPEWTVTALLVMVNLIATLLVFAGLATNRLTPAELLAGRGLGKRPGATLERFRVDTLRGENGFARRIAIPPETGGVSGLALAIQGFSLIPMSQVDEALPRLCFTVSFIILGGAIMWLVWPIVRSTFGSVAVGATTTVMLLGGTCLLSQSDPASVPGTIAFLFAGAVCICVGFTARSKVLRLYGLVVIMAMVVKFAAVDMAGQNSVVRVVSLAVAGVVCFALSLVYARFSSTLEKSSREASPLASSPPERPKEAETPKAKA
ncbi:hypothetical protein [Peptidiphaga sp.]|uniref:hypothetical protein n=1 Tax=Peptidiphaga sp. TaxID=2848648 RepID=UPI003615630F